MSRNELEEKVYDLYDALDEAGKSKEVIKLHQIYGANALLMPDEILSEYLQKLEEILDKP
jgi:hypothetical protein